jgi:hypothetical protein
MASGNRFTSGFRFDNHSGRYGYMRTISALRLTEVVAQKQEEKRTLKTAKNWCLTAEFGKR